jgi:endonuclease YncB( thermonuclease family)
MNGFILALLLAVAPAPPPPARATITNIEIHDGDTFVADIELGFDIVLARQTVRIFAFDAWEITRQRQTVKITDEELIKGRLAKQALETLFEPAVVSVAESGKRDPYGRRSLWVFVNGQEVGAIMRAAGHERTAAVP